MSGRLSQLIGLILVLVACAMSFVVYQSTLSVGGEIGTLIASGIVAWAILALPELALGLWLIARGGRAAKIGDISSRLIPLVQKRGRIGLGAAASELGVDQSVVADAAENLSRRQLPLVYLDRTKNEIVSPSAVTLKESLLHLLLAQRRMTFDQLGRVTNATDADIIEALAVLSKEGRFRGVVDENSRVVYTSEAVSQLPKSVTVCPNCSGKLVNPVLPGEEETCPYCGHVIVNRLRR